MIVAVPRDASSYYRGVKDFDSFEKCIIDLQEEGCSVKNLIHLREFLRSSNLLDSNGLFFTSVLPRIIENATKYSTFFPEGLPLLHSASTVTSVSFTTEQTNCVLCNFFLCTFTTRWTFSPKEGASYSPASLINLFGPAGKEDTEEDMEIKIAKLSMIYHGYFARFDVLPAMSDPIVVTRGNSRPHLDAWLQSDLPMLPVLLSEGGATMDPPDAKDLKSDRPNHPVIRCVSANAFIGGYPSGVTGRGNRSEPILFAAYPEALVALLVAEKLSDHESLRISGVRKLARNNGYAEKVAYAEVVPLEECAVTSGLLLMDALDFRKTHLTQFSVAAMHRELGKLYSGFALCDPAEAIFTAHWGCGAFRGRKDFKMVLQVLAASLLERQLTFFLPTEEFSPADSPFHRLPFVGHPVKAVARCLLEFADLAEKEGELPSLFQFMLDHL